MVNPDRSAHDAYTARHGEVDGDTRARFHQVADLLELQPPLRTAFIATCLKAAQLHAADCALVDHELRSGQSWPAEDRETRDEIQARQWEAFFTQLRAAAEEGRDPEIVDAPEEPAPPFRVRYRPVASISRPPEAE